MRGLGDGGLSSKMDLKVDRGQTCRVAGTKIASHSDCFSIISCHLSVGQGGVFQGVCYASDLPKRGC